MSVIGAIAPADKPGFVETRLAADRDGKGSLPRRPRKPRSDDDKVEKDTHQLDLEA